ncbi:DUF1600 domain-containing protein [Butyrivibrio sp. DSM 10294]|uniref:hypothetical protein n=1 Tax=Butyrivibrio sp. DSM 10294 TaxID=2972457 RepID=UPI00234F875E|nr:hypothetical protein [Butyrivibrio sp. DSM 10294]MDC7294445.1 DUF1600 domain-containing protein [Butyrivibrio sp. DSM 10294]
MSIVYSALPYLLNIAIVVISAVISFSFLRKDGKWCRERAEKAFKFFTTQSNVLCAVAALCMCFFAGAQWAFILKYIGTVAVTVTMLTVIFFLGPSMGGYQKLYVGTELWLHLINPLLALISFCTFERRSMSVGVAALGLLPVILYGILYLYNVIYAPEDKRWDDFYGFNKNGKWPIAFALMVIGTAIICVGLYFVSNIGDSVGADCESVGTVLSDSPCESQRTVPTDSQSAPTESTMELYKGILQHYRSGEEMFSDEGEGYDYSQATAPGYALYDIDGDGVDELFITPRMNDEGHTYVVYYVKNGEVIRGRALNGYLPDSGYWTYYFDYFIDAYEFDRDEGFVHKWEFDYPWVDGIEANTLIHEGGEPQEITDEEVEALLNEHQTEPQGIEWKKF